MNISRKGLTRVQNIDDNVRQTLSLGLVVLVALVAFTGRLLAQSGSAESRGTIRPIFGAYVPTGDQRDFLKDAVFAGAQASVNVSSNIAVTGSFGWRRRRTRLQRAIRRSTPISTTSASRLDCRTHCYAG